MSAVARVIPGAPAGEADVSAALQRARVNTGIDPGALKSLATALSDAGYAAVALPIALGCGAVAARDAYFEPSFAVGIQPGRVLEDGSMDFFDRQLLKPVVREELLGTLHPALAGTPGMRVDGRALPVREARDLQLELGSGVTLQPGGRACATRAGVVVYVAGKSLDVLDHHVHQGDVDMRSGSLDMHGSLTVRGDVQHAFNVRATGDVEIMRNVEAGCVSAGGQVMVRGLIRGGQSASVYAAGDLSGHQAEGATLVAGGTITLDGALHCELSAVSIQARHILRGGAARAEHCIRTREAGSPHGSAATLLAAGSALPNLLEDAQWAQGLQKQRRAAQRLAGGPTRGGGERGKGGKLGRSLAEQQRAELERKVALRQRSSELLPHAEIEVTGTAHAGVTVTLGSAQLVLERPMHQVRFTFDAQTASVQARGLRP